MKNKLNLLFKTRSNKLSLPSMIIIGLTCFFLSQTDVAAQGIPGGSYQKTCKVVSVNGKFLTAICNAKNGKQRLNRNFYFEFCIGDISNENGALFCPKDLKAEGETKAAEEAKKKAEEEAQKITAEQQVLVAPNYSAFAAAAPIVLGRGTYTAEMAYWTKLLMNEYGMSQQVKEGLKFSDAVIFLKKFIARPEGSKTRALVIDYAFREVYGCKSSPTEQAYWDTQVKAQQAWYAPMVLKLTEELNKDPNERRTVIYTVYYMAMGRFASDIDLDYWTPRTEHYRLMLDASRNWLYSPNGVKDLVETVTRALEYKNKKKPTDKEVKDAMANFTAKKMIYSQMIK